jgi:hypothetical protein
MAQVLHGSAKTTHAVRAELRDRKLQSRNSRNRSTSFVTVGRRPFVEPRAVDNSNATRSYETDQSTMCQISQCSTNRFYRQGEVIGDVVTRSR